MKKIILNILIVAILTTGVGGIMTAPKVAEASCLPNVTSVIGGFRIQDCVADFGVVFIMPLTAKFLQISAYLFDKALMLNLSIGKFVSSTETKASPVEVVWKTIRDISGMFFIFVLLFSSIKMILTGESNKGVIVGIVIAGLTVNFSLFITKVLIDASNSAALTIYSAIAPGQGNVGFIDSTVGGAFNTSETNSLYGKDGTISEKIMSVVSLQTLFATVKKEEQERSFNATVLIVVFGGISLMLVLGIAFLAAAVMFLWRFLILLALMAFSPFYALAIAFPQFKKQSDLFSKNLINQCLFAPVFLFFIYIGMSILTNSDFIELSGSKGESFAGVLTGKGIGPLVQYSLAIFTIFTGLGTATSFGAKGGEFGVEWIKGLGKWGQGVVGRTAVGMPAKWAGKGVDALSSVQLGDNKGAFSKTGNLIAKVTGASALTREGVKLTRAGLKNVSNAKFGSGRSLEDIEKSDKDYAKEQRKLGLGRDLKTAIANGDSSSVKTLLGKLSKDEKIKLDKDTLTNPIVAQHLSESDYEAIDKGDKSDKDKVEIRGARKQVLENFVKVISEDSSDKKANSTKEKEGLKTMIGKMSPKEILGLGEMLKKPEVIAVLKASQLKGIVDDIDFDSKEKIRSVIENDKTHQAHGYITSKESSKWGGKNNSEVTKDKNVIITEDLPRNVRETKKYS